MREADEDKGNCQNTKCWNCIYGICVQETELEKMFRPGAVGGSTPVEDPFGMQADRPYQDASEEETEIIEHTMEYERVKTICFWRPESVQNSPPIIMGFVNKCNRYKTND